MILDWYIEKVIGVLDSLAGGNMLARGELAEPLIIGANEPPVFLAGDVLFYLTGNLSKAWKTKVLNIFRGTSMERTAVQLTIPPGAEPRIDSELFLLLLDGENVLHTQSGDWIDISQNLLCLIVKSALGTGIAAFWWDSRDFFTSQQPTQNLKKS